MAAPLNIKISTLTVQERTSSQTKACSVDTRATAAAVPPEVLLWCNLATATQGGKQFHQMSHRKWARCLHMTERDEERRWGARFSYCSSCPCIVFFFFFPATSDDSQADAFLFRPSNFPFLLVSFIFPLPRCLILSSIPFQVFFFYETFMWLLRLGVIGMQLLHLIKWHSNLPVWDQARCGSQLKLSWAQLSHSLFLSLLLARR